MGVNLFSELQIVQAGQKFKVYAQDTFSPAHFIFHSVLGSPTWHRGFQLDGLSSETDNKFTIAESNQTYTHFLRHAALLIGDGTWEYTLDSSQRSQPAGANFSIVLKTLAGTVALRVTFTQHSGGWEISVANHLGTQVVHQDFDTTTFPTNTKVRARLFGNTIEVILNSSTLLWQGPWNAALRVPLTLDYEYWPTTGSSADTSGLTGACKFSEIKLTGLWDTYLPKAYQDLEFAWSVFWRDEEDSLVSGLIPFVQGYDQGAGPWCEITVPAIPEDADHIFVRCDIQGGRLHARGSTTIELHSPDTPEPDLVIAGPNPFILDPGESVYVIVPGFDPDQLTYEAVDGNGSFGTLLDKNLYTAPTDAGVDYTIKVTQGTREVERTVIVRPKISPAQASMVGETAIEFTTNFDVVDYDTDGWDLTGGSFNSQDERAAEYEAPPSVGDYILTAKTGFDPPWDVATANVKVTSSGTMPSSGLRLSPPEGYSAPVGEQRVISFQGDATTVAWAIVNNLRIDGSNNNLILLQNNGVAEALLANCFGTGGGTFVWAFNELNLADTIDSPTYIWNLEDRNGGLQARLLFAYSGSGDNWYVRLFDSSGAMVAEELLTLTDSAEMRIISNSGTHYDFAVRESDSASWTDLATNVLLDGVQLRFRFAPEIRSRANNTVVIAKPTLTGTWGRWVRPNWLAEVLNSAGQVIGSFPATPSENPVTVGGVRTQRLTVTLNTIGNGRVRAVYPSGVEAVNTIPLTVTPSAGGDPLAIESPTFPLTVDPGQTITITANYGLTELQFSATGGTFATSPSTKNQWTAPALAGQHSITVRKGSEQVTVQVTVRPKITPAAHNVQASVPGTTRSVDFSLNTNQGTIGVGVSGGGTVQLIKNTDGTSTIRFFAGQTAGGPHTITAQSVFGTAQAMVTITDAAIPAIEITEPEASDVVEPGATIQIETNYLASQVQFSATGGTFGTGSNRDRWTAPQIAGNYTITVTGPAGSGSDTVTVRVPLRISPKNPAPIKPGESIQFSTNYSPIIEYRRSGDGTWGTLTQSGLLTAGATQGQFSVSVRAIVNGVEYTDSAAVVISGEPLVILNGANLMIPPEISGSTFDGGTHRVLTNKSLSEITFTLSAGNGSFGTGDDENLYTAPTDAGNYKFFVHYLNQTVEVNVHVPVAIAPAAGSVATSGVIDFGVNADVPTFATDGYEATGGTLSLAGGRGVRYTAGVTPGTYALTAHTIKGDVTAPITISISGPALAVLNGTSLTLESGRPWQIQVNYPVTGGDVTFTGSVSGLVSATGRVFPPSTAGTYTVTVSKPGHSDVVVTITVPLRITPASVTATPGQLVQFSVNHPSQVWSADPGAGVINLETGLLVASLTPGGPFDITVTTPVGSISSFITITPVELIVFGPETITLEPGATHEVKTNFPVSALLFQAIGGGSFGFGSSANVYTAPLQAGTYTFRVTVQGGQATKTITVIVPLRITPDSAQVSAGGGVQFSVNAPFANWNVSSVYPGDVGTISSTGLYTAAASDNPPLVTITASAGNQSDAATVFFLTVFPYDPSYTITGRRDRRIALARAEDGSLHGSTKGKAEDYLELGFLNREKAEFEAVRQFWDDRFPEKPFLYHDRNRGVLIPVYFDSALGWEEQGPCEYDYSVRVREV